MPKWHPFVARFGPSHDLGNAKGCVCRKDGLPSVKCRNSESEQVGQTESISGWSPLSSRTEHRKSKLQPTTTGRGQEVGGVSWQVVHESKAGRIH